MDLELWQDDILWQLHGAAGTAGSAISSEDKELVEKYFCGVGQLVDALGENIISVYSVKLVQFNLTHSKAKQTTQVKTALLFVL